MAKRKLTRRQSWRIKKIQEERAARAQKAEQAFEEQLQAGELGTEQKGLIIAHYGRQVDVEALSGPQAGELFRCNLRANLDALVTGDRVVWCAGPDNTGVVVANLPRHSLLSRPDMREQLRPVAANIDYIVIVIAPEPYAHANLIDRYLVAAETIGIEPVLLLNKVDLLNEKNRPRLERLQTTYQQVGYRVLQASTHSQHGLDELKALLNHRISVFVGQSGVGKSSLVNTLLPGVDLKVAELSATTGKGMHTTTTARLFHLPDGGDLIDSPGIREFALWHIDEATLEQGFREFRPYLGTCKFRDCRHRQEPGCALHRAVEEGTIRPERLKNFLQIADSLSGS